MSTSMLVFAGLIVVCMLGLASTIDTTNKRLDAISTVLWAIRDELKREREKS